jgi:hypothetical protein
VSLENGQLLLSWPSSLAGFVLQQTAGLNPIAWQNSNATVNQQGDQSVAQIALAEAEGYYRLMRP